MVDNVFSVPTHPTAAPGRRHSANKRTAGSFLKKRFVERDDFGRLLGVISPSSVDQKSRQGLTFRSRLIRPAGGL